RESRQAVGEDVDPLGETLLELRIALRPRLERLAELLQRVLVAGDCRRAELGVELLNPACERLDPLAEELLDDLVDRRTVARFATERRVHGRSCSGSVDRRRSSPHPEVQSFHGGWTPTARKPQGKWTCSRGAIGARSRGLAHPREGLPFRTRPSAQPLPFVRGLATGLPGEHRKTLLECLGAAEPTRFGDVLECLLRLDAVPDEPAADDDSGSTAACPAVDVDDAASFELGVDRVERHQDLLF